MCKLNRKISERHHNFKKNYANGASSKMQELAKGQSPHTLIIGCSDSRCDPALLIEAEPGEIFSVRSVANMVHPFKHPLSASVGSALEFGINALKVKNLVIMGHSDCGGVKGLQAFETLKDTHCLKEWLPLVNPEEVKDLELEECIKKLIDVSYENCMTYPWIQEKVNSKELTVHRWFFNIEEGQIYTLEDGAYKPL